MNLQYSSRKAVILDRDGTIVMDKHYLKEPAELEFMEGAVEGLRAMYAQGLLLVVVTNQSGIARGLFKLDQLQKIHIRLQEMLSNAGVRLSGIYFCPHTDQDRCACRKPAPGLILRAAREIGFVPGDCIVIGDKDTDMQLGASIGARTIRIGMSAEKNLKKDILADCEVANLSHAAQIVHEWTSADLANHG